jgi:hypothetical protein
MTQIAPHRFDGAVTRALRWSLAALALAFLTITISGNAMSAERRVALVVGNAQYKNPSLVLTNPKNDSEDVAAALRDLGFEVVYASDVTKRDFDMSLAQFARMATGADAALFYYAGHALQFQGRNYLMPTDAELEDDVSIRYQMESIEDVRDALERTAGVKILILDACRNNPVAERLQRRVIGQGRSVNMSRGLARIDRAEGLVVSYATAADQIAMDGRGRNSPYTTALLKRLREPGLEIEMMFRRIAADVNSQTNGQQRPETYVSLISEFYINQKDRMVWDGIKTADNADVVRDFIEAYPHSPYVSEAQTRLRALDRAVREKQAAAQLAQREAAEAKEREDQRVRIAVLEREEKARADRDAAQKRADDEKRAQAEAERLRKQEEERTKLAALERTRIEQDALRQRQEAEQRAKAEAAKKLQDQEQERARLAALERARIEQDALRQRQDAEQRAKAEAAKKLKEQERARLAALERTRIEQAAKAAPVQPAPVLPAPVPAAAAPTEPQADSCKQDEQRLAQLRAAPEPDDIVKFEREMTCAKLRAQVARLRESLGIAQSAALPALPASRAPAQPVQRSAPVPPAQAAPVAPPAPAAPAAQASLQTPPPARAQSTAASSEESCKHDEQRLVQLRASRSLTEIAQFIKDLRCEKLRLQAVRLRESVAGK